MKQLFKAKYIILNSRRILKDGAILVENGKIKNIIENSDIPIYDEVLDFGNSVLMPGFMNIHCHLQFTNLNKTLLAENIEFSDWIIELIEQYASFSQEEKIKSFKDGLKQALLSGTTCICNIAREPEFIEILENCGINYVNFIEMFSNSEETSTTAFNQFKETLNALKTAIGASPHSIYNTDKTLWDRVTKFCNDNNILVQTHLAESIDETLWANNKTSSIDKIHNFAGWDKTAPAVTSENPVEYIFNLNIPQTLKNNLILAHLNQADFKSFEKLDSFGVNIAHCPRSNKILHGKTLDLKKIITSKLFNNKIGLGTDSLFSNEDLSVFNEAKYACKLNDLDFWTFFELLTVNPSKILKIDNKTGSLEIEKQADFVIFNLNQNENYTDIINKETPNYIYIKGVKAAENGVITIDI